MPWFEIYVEDMKRARKFYEGLLGVELNLEDMPGGEMEMYLFPGEMSLPRAAGALIKHPMRKPNEQGHLLYFSMPDCATTAEWAAEAGVPVFVEKQSIGEHGFIAIIGASEGNAVGFIPGCECHGPDQTSARWQTARPARLPGSAPG